MMPRRIRPLPSDEYRAWFLPSVLRSSRSSRHRRARLAAHDVSAAAAVRALRMPWRNDAPSDQECLRRADVALRSAYQRQRCAPASAGSARRRSVAADLPCRGPKRRPAGAQPPPQRLARAGCGQLSLPCLTPLFRGPDVCEWLVEEVVHRCLDWWTSATTTMFTCEARTSDPACVSLTQPPAGQLSFPLAVPLGLWLSARTRGCAP